MEMRKLVYHCSTSSISLNICVGCFKKTLLFLECHHYLQENVNLCSSIFYGHHPYPMEIIVSYNISTYAIPHSVKTIGQHKMSSCVIPYQMEITAKHKMSTYVNLYSIKIIAQHSKFLKTIT